MNPPDTSQPESLSRGASAQSSAAGAVEVAAGLVFRQGRLLITQRRPGDHLGGLWEFPGGKREDSESFEACLERELREELGIAVQVQECLQTMTHRYPEKIVHLRFFRCRWAKGEPEALGCQALEWVTQAELKQFAFPAADERLLTMLEARPELWAEPSSAASQSLP